MRLVIAKILNNIAPQNWVAGVYAGKFAKTNASPMVSFTGQYILSINVSGSNYNSIGCVSAQGSLFTAFYENANWEVRETLQMTTGILAGGTGILNGSSSITLSLTRGIITGAYGSGGWFINKSNDNYTKTGDNATDISITSYLNDSITIKNNNSSKNYRYVVYKYPS